MLPSGYLDFDARQYERLSVEVQREVYHAMRDIVRYTLGVEKTGHATLLANPCTPVDWIMAVKRLECICERCRGTGTYYWGACVNGIMQHSAPCARCGGDGCMTFDDMRRGRAYDKHAIVRACRV